MKLSFISMCKLFIIFCVSFGIFYILFQYFFSNKIKQMKFNRYFKLKDIKKPPHTCAHQKTSDPRIFGPEMWITLHRIAANYLENPTNEEKKQAINFINSLPYMIPCQHCGRHFLAYLEDNNVNVAVTSKESLVRFFVNAHNNVNRHLGKKEWDVEDAQIYEEQYFCNDDKPIWK